MVDSPARAVADYRPRIGLQRVLIAECDIRRTGDGYVNSKPRQLADLGNLRGQTLIFA